MDLLKGSNFQEIIERTKSKISVPVIIIVFLALIFGMYGGTPIEHGDNLEPKAKTTIHNFGNPKFFTYPALMIYMNASVYIVYEMVLKVLPEKLHRTLDKWPYKDIPGHLLTVILSIIGALSVYGICFILTKSRLYSTIGSIFLITSPLWNANSHFITVDIALSSLIGFTLFVMMYILEQNQEITSKHMIILGILTGITASAKYNGAVIALAVIAVIVFRIRPLKNGIKLLFIYGIFAIITFLLINPFILISFRTFIHDFLYTLNIIANGFPGFTVTTLHHHLSKSLYFGWNLGPILLSVLGTIMTIKSRKFKIYSKVAILLFPFVYIMILLSTKMTFDRYALPLIPFLAILAAYALFEIGQYVKNRFYKTQKPFLIFILPVFILIVLGVNTYQSLRHNFVMQKKDTRIILGNIFSKNNKRITGLKIGAGNYCLNFLGTSAKKEKMCWVGNSDVEITNDYDIIVLDSFTHDRYINDKNMRLQIDFSRFSKGRLITISPYTHRKISVPFSSMSMYSPYYPDLPFRVKPGPYIEIYFTDPQLAQMVSQTMIHEGIGFTAIDFKQGYYYRMFAKDISRKEKKPLSEEAKKASKKFITIFQKWKSGRS